MRDCRLVAQAVRLRAFVSLGLALLLALPPAGIAQIPAGSRLIVNTVSNNIKVNIGSKAPDPSVRVLDENGRPVQGATVTFTIVAPDAAGPGATFPGDAKSLTVTTDARGDAVAHGLRPNQVTGGPYVIQVQAHKAGMASPEAPANIAAENVMDIQQLVITAADVFENNTCKGTSGELKVQVKDDRGNPVVGAAVTFRVPTDGATGVFTGGSATRTVNTDDTGQVLVKEFTPNKTTGDFTVEAVASLADLKANVAVPGSNIRKDCSKTALIVVVVAAVAGGATAAALAGKKGSGSSGSTTTTNPPPAIPSITIGSGGDPRFGPGH